MTDEGKPATTITLHVRLADGLERPDKLPGEEMVIEAWELNVDREFGAWSLKMSGRLPGRLCETVDVLP